MNETPKAERPHVVFFGRTNVGKSSLVNAIAGQALSLVADQPGTTTDPVEKAMEMLPAGPVLLIDTPGLDDTSELGSLRVARAQRELVHTDLAVLVGEAGTHLSASETAFLSQLTKARVPVLTVFNKCDRLPLTPTSEDIFVSAKTGYGIKALIERIAHTLKEEAIDRPLIRDLVAPNDCCILVVPIDSAAPKGRLILPQQQVIRDLLAAQAEALVVSCESLPHALTRITPKLVVCDSQVFARVSAATPSSIPLTSFSILMARYKGTLKPQIEGIAHIPHLKDHDRILMAEGCTHHRQCDDIGTVKIPRWLTEHTGKNLAFTASSGKGYPDDLSPYAMVILCGGCMVNAREMQYRLRKAQDAGIAVTNYGLCIAYLSGVLQRSLELFPDLPPIPNLS